LSSEIDVAGAIQGNSCSESLSARVVGISKVAGEDVASPCRVQFGKECIRAAGTDLTNK
jgi:hypothetical protein